MKTFIDWIAFTEKEKNKEDLIENVLKLEICDLQEMDRGMLGYRKMEIIEDIKVLTEGREDMGIHCICSGGSIALKEQKEDILDFLQRLEENNIQVTRLDIAIDVKQTEEFNIEMIRENLIKGNIISKWRTSDERTERIIHSAEVTGKTLYFGSRTSNVFLRIYDKELESKGNPLFKDIMRFEIELKKESAQKTVKLLLKEERSKIIKGILTNYIRIATPGKDKNKSRWKNNPEWDKFIEDIDKVKVSKAILDKSLEEKFEWFEKQNGPTMALLHIANSKKLDGILKNGYNRLKNKDLVVLDTHLKRKSR